MDILISSNLERLLHACTHGDAAQVKAWMDQLSETGRYEVSGEVKKAMDRDFAAAWCDDAAAKAAIGTMWREKNYLIDPHTAVAVNALEQYRARSGDDAPALVVSTASPFKFCPAVMEALGVKDPARGLDSITQLSQLTGLAAPEPLASLAGKTTRFDKTVSKEAMVDAVREMLR